MPISIILPTYNERGNILDLISAIQQSLKGHCWPYKLIVVDDDSPDGTGLLVREHFRLSPEVEVIIRKNERGLASAIKTGIITSSGDAIVVMDTDFNHDPGMIPQMVEFLKYYDLVIGSRFVMGGGMEDLRRYYFSFLFNFFVRVVIRTQIQDNLSGFFAIRRDKLLTMDLDRIFRGYGDYFICLLHVAWRHNFKILEVPVFYQLRRHGKSKAHFLKMLLDYTSTVLALRFGQ